MEQPLPEEGEPFFDVYDQPAEPVRKVLDFLQQVATNRAQSATLCARLAEHGLIQPWPLQVTTPDGERPVEGLHRIDETALNALSTEPFETLRQAGALPLIYCQLLSMQQVALLGKLAEHHAQSKPALDASEMFGESDTLSFDWGTP
ncbi:SapC family protein [Lamprobacter modestohalophilus]|uniref:SapC family protein n=1 Tax=Lamprobacter modestohalophilus TaxID=1064514 RepID=UPI002ADEEB3E|nr:SapC family protein [Lamprobacter modestohalophilus]MEA1053627.1 SapC family protein [Lamprobacter modestohalophilus]